MFGIVTGLPEEADAFAPGLGQRMAHGRIALRQLDWHGVPVTLACGGIGKVAAATAATLLAGEFGAQCLMVIGTAGALRPADTAPHWLSCAIQHDYGAARPDRFAHYEAGSWPFGPDGVSGLLAMPQPVGLGLAETIVASGDCFVECGDRAALIRDALGATLVDMETAAVAQVASLLGIKWCGIKALTDDANSESTIHFGINLTAAANRAARAAEQAILLLSGQPNYS